MKLTTTCDVSSNSLFQKIFKPALDKQLHFFVGISVSSLLYIAFPRHLLAVCIATTCIGAGKEIKDKLWYGTPDMEDFVYTVAGCIPVILLTLIK